MNCTAPSSVKQQCGTLQRDISTKKNSSFQRLRKKVLFLELFHMQFTLRVSLASYYFIFLLLSHDVSRHCFHRFPFLFVLKHSYYDDCWCYVVYSPLCLLYLQDLRWALKTECSALSIPLQYSSQSSVSGLPNLRGYAWQEPCPVRTCV